MCLLVFLFLVVELMDGLVFFMVFFFLMFCLFNSFLMEKLIGNFGVWDEFDGLLLFCFGLDMSDLMLKDMFLVVVGFFFFIVLWVDCSLIFFSMKGFFVCVLFLECLVVLLFVVLVWNWSEFVVNSYFICLMFVNIGFCLMGYKMIVLLLSKFVVDKW